MTEQSLADVVRQQAEARVRGDDAWFATWMTPQALLHLRSAPRGARSVRVLEVAREGDTAVSRVRYATMRESYIIEQRWLLADGAWRCLAASIPERRPTMLGRVAALFGRGASPATART